MQVGASIGRLQEEAKAIKNDLSAAHSQQKSRQTSKILSDFEVCYSMCKAGCRQSRLSRNSVFLSGLCQPLQSSQLGQSCIPSVHGTCVNRNHAIISHAIILLEHERT